MTSRYELRQVGVYDRERQRLVVRHDPAWTDYQLWLADGNSPDPMPVAPPVSLSPAELAARKDFEMRKQIHDYLKSDGDVQALKAMSLSQVEEWIDNIQGLNDVRKVLKAIAKATLLPIKERL